MAARAMLIITANAALSLAWCGGARAALEVPAVLDAVALRACTVPGARAVRDATLAPSVAAANEQYALVEEALALGPESAPPLNHPLDFAPVVRALQEQETLDAATLAEVGCAVEALSALAGWRPGQDACPRLAALCASAAPPARVAAKFCGTPPPFVQLSTGAVSLSSDAFPILRSRRAAMRSAEGAVEGEMGRLMADRGFQRQLAAEDAQVQRRDGRLVVPVPPQGKRAVGVEVSRSRRGATVFVEPHSVVGLSAAARAAAVSLAAAEARLLLGLTLLLRRELPPLLAAVETAAIVDGAMARARLGRLWDGVIPTVGEGGMVRLPQVRHPLLALQALEQPTALIEE